MTDTRSTCPYCGVGCGVIIESEGTRITGVRGDPDHPANVGRLCSKGQTLHLTAADSVARQTRLLHPMQRPARGAAPVRTSWDEALNLAARRFNGAIATHGPDAVGFYISGQLLTEDYYVFNKLAKGLIGTNNVDTNSRLCMSSAVAGYKLTLGADAPPACYDDLNHADCLFIVGSNAAFAHPVLFRRLEDARRTNPDMKVIVADPRRTDTAGIADLYLPLQPGTDVMLFHGLLHIMLWEGWTDAAYIERHTSGFDALKALVRECTPERVAQVCGLSEEDLFTAARWFATGASTDPQARGATLSLYCQGLNQSSSGTAKNASLINLHLATGQIGKPGAGPFSLTGQPNAMGGRESGGMATLLPGHRDPAKAEDWAALCKLWGVADLPSRRGHTAVELFEAAARGEIRALWIACTNPAQSMPDQALVRAALARCELVIVQEAFSHTTTAARADYLLPAATWGEKDGTVTNSERRISRVRAAVPPPGQARPDWQIARDIAALIDTALHRPPRLAADGPQDLWLEHREATRGRDLDITGLTWDTLETAGPQQWPFVHGPTPRLYTDGRFATDNGRARFIARPYQAPAERPSAELPFSLTTSRLRDQWHGMSRSGSVPGLFAHEGRPSVRLHPADAARHALQDGALVTVRSRRGAVVLPLKLDENLPPAVADIAMHWGDEFIGAQLGVNTVTSGAACPESRQPELKFSAVAIEPAALPWRLSACAWVAPEAGTALRDALRALMPRFGYSECLPQPARGEQVGWTFEAACADAPAPDVVNALIALLQLNTPTVARYDDVHRGRLRLLSLDGPDRDTAPLRALLRVGPLDEGAWLVDLWRARAPAASAGRWLLSPSAPPLNTAPASPQVCNCFDVRENVIRLTLAHCSGSPAERLAQLQAEKRCGTQCGSCLPALRRLVAATDAEAVPA